MYTLILSKKFLRKFENLLDKDKNNIKSILQKLKDKSVIIWDKNIKQLVWYKWFFRYRYWSIRIWFFIDNENNILEVLYIDNRWDFYKKFPKNFI